MKTQETECGREPQNREASERFFKEIELEFLVHELKDPLAIIESNMRMLLKKVDKYGPYTTGLEKIINRSLKNAVKASDMLYGLLEIGKSGSGNIKTSECPVDLLLIDTINETLELLSDYSCVEINDMNKDHIAGRFPDFGVILSMPDHVRQSVMNQDIYKIKQILGNLIKNALHYRDKTVNIESDIVNGYLLVHVRDDGPGIEPEHCDLIFKRYAQANECGPGLKRNKHGLGLASARIIARYLGGDITVRSAKKCGADFEMRLPLDFNQ